MGQTTTPLERAIAICGNKSRFAKRLGINPQNVWHWINKSGGKVPAELCRKIEMETGGHVTRYELRPDVFGSAPPVEPKQVA